MFDIVTVSLSCR